MKNRTYRFWRFNPLFKWCFNIRWIDKILRRVFVSKFHNNHYKASSSNSMKINDELNPILKKYTGFLGHGLALSIIRDNKLPTNQDLDYDIYDCSDIESLIHDMEELEYELDLQGFVENECKMLTFSKYNSYIDFFMCNVTDNEFTISTITCLCINPKFYYKNNRYYSNKYSSYNRKMTYVDIEEKKYGNNSIFLPKQYEQYFSEMYGSDWTKPKKYYNWSIEPKNNKPIVQKKNVSANISVNSYLEFFQ